MNTVFIMKVLNKLTIDKYHRRTVVQHNTKISQTTNNILTEYTNGNQSIQ